jgi:RimJ/RimL family protein N-acetyltransferase
MSEVGHLRSFDFSYFPERIMIDDGLVIDGFTLEDVPRLSEITDHDNAVQKYIPWAKEDKMEYITRVNRDRRSRGPRYAVRLDGVLVGHIAVFPSHDIKGVIEMGYILSPEARGRGVLDKAMPTIEALVLEGNPGARLALCINDNNIPSQNVAKRLGYHPSEVVSDGDRVYFKVVV